MMKSLKFWQNWFHRAETVPAVPAPVSGPEIERKPLSHIAVRAALKQKQRQARNAG
ncbi:MAG TPA: hypothetical protein VFX11_09520 [Candidatus Kapabacteria bacterium]|nr:hypothetical protein [Candidatus Kapabacteria bacterium]